ncbi:MAG: HD domain-containing protein [Lachnospiraceae bacterium]|nr:HD domain-containing protein [Lachnospiraceae bacterium]
MYQGNDDFERTYYNIMEIYKRTGNGAVVQEDLADAIDHGVLVTKTVRLLCEASGIADEYKEMMLTAAGLHDIGKLQMGQMLYGRNKGAMKIEEMRYMRMHAENAKKMLEVCEYPDAIVQAVYHHHENFDGSGYPDNLAGSKIPFSARVLKVCDTFCALVSERPYRKAFEFDTALEMMIEDSKDLDMGIFLEFLKLYHSEEFNEIKEYATFANRKKHYLHGA